MYDKLARVFQQMLKLNEYSELLDLATEVREAVKQHTTVDQYVPRGCADELFYDIHLGVGFSLAGDMRSIAQAVPEVEEILKTFLEGK